MKEQSFPIIKAGYIFNHYSGDIKNLNLKKIQIELKYPCRLDAMAINPAAVCYNDSMVFTPGEVVISLKKFIKVKIKVTDFASGTLEISPSTRRKVLVKHSYLLMCAALNVSPSLYIDVDDSAIPKHCGFGSSSSTIAAVAAAINELYGCPISNEDLIKYLAANHGEEVSDKNENDLKVVQCIGGGATNGLSEEGIIIISGKSTPIAKMKYESDVLIALPRNFIQKDAKELMELEEKNLWKFKKTGEQYAEKIAYNLLHKALPGMVNGSIKELADVVYEDRFNMGSNENCSFVYDKLMDISDGLRPLYEDNHCEFLSLSSVGPAFFALVSNDKQKEYCLNIMKKLDLDVIDSSICNTKYEVVDSKDSECYWTNENTNLEFQNRPVSKYITDQIDQFNIFIKKCIDIGCGGGRYSKYLDSKNSKVLAIDKYYQMFDHTSGINFINCSMDNIPVVNSSYFLALSIGVMHNATTISEYEDSFKEIYRILEFGGTAIISVFTDDVITSDLSKTGKNTYNIKNRPPMVLYSKQQVLDLVKKIGFKDVMIVDEHVTDVGGGCRNVFTITVKK